MGRAIECEVIASEDAIGLLVRALRQSLEEDGFGHLKVGLLEGPAVFEYVRGRDVVAISTQPAHEGLRLVVESETLDVTRIVQEAMARAAADLFHELLSGQSGRSACVSPSEVRAELVRLLDAN